MAEEKWEITNRELLVFFGSMFLALLIMVGGGLGLFDPMTAGIAVVMMVVFFTLSQWLEARGVIAKQMSIVFIVFGLGVVMITAGLIHRGVIPLVVKMPTASLLALVLTNAMVYAILILAIVAVGLAVYVFYFRKGIPIGAKKAQATIKRYY